MHNHLTIICRISRRAGSCIVSIRRSCPLLKTTARAIRSCVVSVRRDCSGWGKRNSLWGIPISYSACVFKETDFHVILSKHQTGKNKTKIIYILNLNCYPNRSSAMVALYWEGISIKAERANSVCFLDGSTFFDMISVKLTNYIHHKNYSLRITEQLRAMNMASQPLFGQVSDTIAHLEIIKCPRRDVVIEFLHQVPRPISHPDYYYRQGELTAKKTSTWKYRSATKILFMKNLCW